jgi:hypothetical protein
VERAAPMRPPEYFQRLALQGVMVTDDRYAFWIAIEVVVVGSVSCLPLTRFHTPHFWKK